MKVPGGSQRIGIDAMQGIENDADGNDPHEMDREPDRSGAASEEAHFRVRSALAEMVSRALALVPVM